MSLNTNWDLDRYREEHESEDHWELRRAFMERWKNDYPEERLVCLARVFANMELLGCRYPGEVMQEVSRLSFDVAKLYRNSRKDKLKRTFVSASDAAEDRARGIKREGGVVINGPPAKSSRISFVPQGHTNNEEVDLEQSNNEDEKKTEIPDPKNIIGENREKDIELNKNTSQTNDYLNEMMNIKCLDTLCFNERMFHTNFGRFVLIIRPWIGKLSNIQASCQACNIQLSNTYENSIFSLFINGKNVCKASGESKAAARAIVETMAWNKIRSEVVSVIVKQQWIAQGDARVSLEDVTAPQHVFGTPIESSVAMKMMQTMGWKGGGLGADSQGIAEPIKPHLQLVNRAGLGSQSRDIRHLRRAAEALMRRYIASDTLDVDLVFSSDFSKEERAALHKVACSTGLASKSYGNEDRFLVVKKKLDPFCIVRAVIAKGGETPKYQVFLPEYLKRHIR